MGGLVVESALRKLSFTAPSSQDEDDTSFDLRQNLALVLTLGAPRHHLPSFLPPSLSSSLPPLHTLFSSSLLKKKKITLNQHVDGDRGGQAGLTLRTKC